MIQPKTAQKMQYLPFVDGLRAVAVLAVIVFHAFPLILPNGYLGVDLFFVISGFLITRIILNEINSGTFSILNFWARRIRRIIPSLLVVILVVLLVGWAILLEKEAVQLGKHAIAGLLFVSNIVYHGEAGYFDVSAHLKPLLHLWSLGIEEQFYIIWPFILVLLPGSIVLRIVSVIVISVCTAVIRYSTDVTAAFYLLDARMWQLAVGGFVAYLEFRGHVISKSWLKYFGGGAGFVLLITSILVPLSAKYFPLAAALLVALSFYLLVCSKAGKVHRFLSLGWMRRLGRLSYPIYLWHWPLLVFAGILGLKSIFWIVAALVLSYGLAVMTHQFVEVPLLKAPKVIVKICVANMTLVVCGVLLFCGELEPLSNAYGGAQVSRAIDDWDYPPKTAKEYPFQGESFSLLGNLNPDTVLFMGDSNIEQFAPLIEKIVVEGGGGRSAIFVTRGGCPPIYGILYLGDECGKKFKKVDAFIREFRIKKIVIGAYWYDYFIRDQFYLIQNGHQVFTNRSWNGLRVWLEALEQQIRRYQVAGAEVIIVANIPISPRFNPKEMFSRDVRDNFFHLKIDPVAVSDLEPEVVPLNAEIEEFGKRLSVKVIRPIQDLCPESSCAVWKDGPVYKDISHMRPAVARDLKVFNDVLN